MKDTIKERESVWEEAHQEKYDREREEAVKENERFDSEKED